VYLKISQGLLLEHQALFALRLAQIRLEADFEYLFELLLKQTHVCNIAPGHESELIGENVLGGLI